MTKEQIE